ALLVPLSLLGLFGLLEFLPVLEDGLGIRRVGIAKDVRVPADELFRDGRDDVVDVKPARLACDLTVEDYLQEDVAQLFDQGPVVALIDRVQHFVGLFDQVFLEGVVILLAIPGATAGAPELGHDRDQRVEGVLGWREWFTHRHDTFSWNRKGARTTWDFQALFPSEVKSEGLPGNSLLKRLARFEGRHFALGDFNGLSRGWVDAFAGGTVAHLKGAKPDESHLFAALESLFDGAQNGFDALAGSPLGEAGFFGDLCDQLALIHGCAPFPGISTQYVLGHLWNSCQVFCRFLPIKPIFTDF